jgi:ABC-type sugar transport system ATPase subunit
MNFLIGRYAKVNAKDKKPDTFDFLGFTHFCDKTRKGRFRVSRKTRRKKINISLKKMNSWLKAIRNRVKTREWWKIVSAKLRGHFEYYDISGNYTALARSLASQPSSILMYEPLSNLDAKLRVKMRIELKRLHSEIKQTILYVTHDQM